jgi:hypothetical protein
LEPEWELVGLHEAKCGMWEPGQGWIEAFPNGCEPEREPGLDGVAYPDGMEPEQEPAGVVYPAGMEPEQEPVE